MNGARTGPELGAGLAAASALGAGFAHLAIFWTLGSALGGSEAVYALGGIVAYGAFFALLAPRLGEPAAEHLGLLRPTARSLLAGALLAASVLLISEIDNGVRAAFPLPAELAKLLEEDRPASLADALELVLVHVAVLPLVFALFYRGLLQPILTRRLGAIRGVLLTGALEATAGSLLLLWSWPFIATRAVVLGILRQSSGSLVPALLLDALMGVVQTAARYELFGIPGFDAGGAHTPPGWLAAAALPTALGLWLCRDLARAPKH